jgi:hypothetical protein
MNYQYYYQFYQQDNVPCYYRATVTNYNSSSYKPNNSYSQLNSIYVTNTNPKPALPIYDNLTPNRKDDGVSDDKKWLGKTIKSSYTNETLPTKIYRVGDSDPKTHKQYSGGIMGKDNTIYLFNPVHGKPYSSL